MHHTMHNYRSLVTLLLSLGYTTFGYIRPALEASPFILQFILQVSKSLLYYVKTSTFYFKSFSTL